MAILVTGGTGFVGAEVVRCLLDQGGQNVVVFDINPARQRLDDVAAHVDVVRGDLANFSHVLDVVRKAQPSVIYHLAHALRALNADPAAALRTNALGTFHILEAARLFGIPQFLFSSTVGAYGSIFGATPSMMIPSSDPSCFMVHTKVFCEHMGLFYRRKYGLDFRAVRYPSVVGPGVKTPGLVQYQSWSSRRRPKGNRLRSGSSQRPNSQSSN